MMARTLTGHLDFNGLSVSQSMVRTRCTSHVERSPHMISYSPGPSYFNSASSPTVMCRQELVAMTTFADWYKSESIRLILGAGSNPRQ